MGVFRSPGAGRHPRFCLKDSLDTIEVSREITLKDCKQGIIGGLFDSVLRVFAPLC